METAEKKFMICTADLKKFLARGVSGSYVFRQSIDDACTFSSLDEAYSMLFDHIKSDFVAVCVTPIVIAKDG